MKFFDRFSFSRYIKHNFKIMTIIALLTDFGTKGQHYVASMKGVILRINPTAQIVDISHNIAPYSVIEASYVLKSTYAYFPKGTVFVVVVDPGVGTSRDILAIKTKLNYYFIGPNNGIFYNALEFDTILECVKITNDKYFNKPVSNTFHGRDIMAPVAAQLTNCISLNNFGDQFYLDELVKHPIVLEKISDNKFKCTIQYADEFGNIITNLTGDSFSLRESQVLKLVYRGNEYRGKFFSCFASVPKNTLLFLVGSSGFLEISKNQGNATKDLGLNVGDVIEITF